ncbi:MAG: permease, partial [Planctomycetota bacterium]|nr:permease [Planctomycetota bacterium]
TFLYSGPAINILAIIMTGRVLGLKLGAARAIGAVIFSIIIGLLMALIFRRDEARRVEAAMKTPEPPPPKRSPWQTALYFAGMLLFLIFSDWFNTNDVTITMRDGTVIEANIRYRTVETMDIQRYDGNRRLLPGVQRLQLADIEKIAGVPSLTMTIHSVKWYLAGAMLLAVLVMVWKWFDRDEIKEWMSATWDFAKMIVPLLFGGVFVTGFIGALLPDEYVAGFVGGNGLAANFFASFVGMIWYFATLTEIPIVEMLMRLGMGKGPAMALLLAGPALSLPSMLVIYRTIGLRKTAVFCALTVVMSTAVGMLFGSVAG